MKEKKAVAKIYKLDGSDERYKNLQAFCNDVENHLDGLLEAITMARHCKFPIPKQLPEAIKQLNQALKNIEISVVNERAQKRV